MEDYSEGLVHPHEQTLSGPKKDRTELLRRTRAHFGQIFMLYPDPKQQASSMRYSMRQRKASRLRSLKDEGRRDAPSLENSEPGARDRAVAGLDER